MYLTKLTPSERNVFTKLAYELINCDSMVDDGETNHMKNCALEMGIRFHELDTSMSFKDALCEAKHLSPKTKRIILTELMIVAFSDCYLAEIERKLLCEIEDALQTDNETSSYCEKIAKEYNRINTTIDKFIERGFLK